MSAYTATVLMVAEKPSLAQSLAQILSGGRMSTRKGGNSACSVHCYQGTFLGQRANFKFTSVCGHVLTTDFPKQYNNWDRVDPAELFEAEVIKKEANPNLRIPGFLEREARGCDHLVLWLDCDKEGENICFEVIQSVSHAMRISFDRPQTVHRARFSAITEKDIKHAMNTLVLPNELEARSVDARQELDLRVGVAFTRFQTKFFQGKYGDLDSALISYGPCQTPTLGFCVDRHDKILSFKPEPYWVLVVTVSTDVGGRSGDFHAQTIQLDWDREREFNHSTAVSYLNAVKSVKFARVLGVSKSTKSKQRPIALNTVELMRVCSSQLGIGPHQAMNIAERLYTQGYISYPRTETTAYPENFDLLGTLQLQANNEYWGRDVRELLDNRAMTKPRPGKDAGDHPPITPMRGATQHELGDRDAWRVYEYIALHFCGTISPDLVYEQTRINLEIGREKFSKTGNVLVSPGYTVFMTWQGMARDQVLPPSLAELRPGTELPVVDCKLNERQTSPPDYLTESELISLMEKHGIGTDASIPTHINNICVRNYVKISATGRRLQPTQLGIVLVHGYQRIDWDLVRPTKRAELEQKLNLIASGRLEFNTVLTNAIQYYRSKYLYFTANIGGMDQLFEVSFSTLAESGKAMSRCGACRRYLKFISARPQRLYCSNCDQTFSVPQNGAIKQYKEMRCPADDFELLYYTPQYAGQRGFVFCPQCFNNPPFEEMPKSSSCMGCAHPTCSLSGKVNGISSCPQCQRGQIILDQTTGQGSQSYKIICNTCETVWNAFKEASRVIVSQQNKCETCKRKLVRVDYPSAEKSKLPGKALFLEGCMFCTPELVNISRCEVGRGQQARAQGVAPGQRGGGRGGAHAANGNAPRRQNDGEYELDVDFSQQDSRGVGRGGRGGHRGGRGFRPRGGGPGGLNAFQEAMMLRQGGGAERGGRGGGGSRDGGRPGFDPDGGPMGEDRGGRGRGSRRGGRGRGRGRGRGGRYGSDDYDDDPASSYVYNRSRQTTLASFF